jgi:hypothetical protein
MVVDHQTFQSLLQISRQFCIGQRLVGKGGAIATIRYIDGVQHGATRCIGQVRIIRMEVGSSVNQAHRLSVFVNIGKYQDIGVIGMMEGVNDVRLGSPPAAGKVDHGPRRQVLPWQNNEAVGMQGRFKPGKLRIAEWLRHVEFSDAGAQDRRERSDVHADLTSACQVRTFEEGTSKFPEKQSPGKAPPA